MKSYWGIRVVAPRILWPRLYMGASGYLHAPDALLPGKESHYPLDRRLGGPQNRSGHGVEEKNSQPPPEIELRTFIRPARS
jgi:hypothetical protein